MRKFIAALTDIVVTNPQITEKNDQIDKLIKRVTTLHALNNEFASEHEKLQKQMLDLQQQCARYGEEKERGCVACREHIRTEEQHRIDNCKLSAENGQLLNDIQMLKTLVYRLNVQLERYQELLRKHPTDSVSEIKDSARLTETAPSSVVETIQWGGVNTNALAPLLNAYQETINDKTELIRQYEMELNQTTGRIKDILFENEQLHAEMDQMRRFNDSWMTEKTRLQAQLDVCRWVLCLMQDFFEI